MPNTVLFEYLCIFFIIHIEDICGMSYILRSKVIQLLLELWFNIVEENCLKK
jgi:hypothetical protein